MRGTVRERRRAENHPDVLGADASWPPLAQQSRNICGIFYPRDEDCIGLGPKYRVYRQSLSNQANHCSSAIPDRYQR
jgi:hypothetical protein